MNKYLILLLAILLCATANAQQTYTVDGQEIKLKTEISGELDLLWTISDGKYRYFLQKSDGTLVELKNTRENREYQEEYKQVLRQLRPDSPKEVEKTDLTLYDLSVFVDDYNSSADNEYQSQVEKISILIRFEAFAGVTNSPLVTNQTDAVNPQLGIGFELIDQQSFPRHALFFTARYVFNSDVYEYDVTELGLGYRYRIINNERFSLYGNLVYSTLSFLDTTIIFETEEEDVPVAVKSTEFDAPFSLGLGADFRLNNRSFVTVGYHEIISVLADTKNFSKNVTIGYKMNL